MANEMQPGCFPAGWTDFPGPYQKSRELPVGDWHMMANGRIFKLTIEGVSGDRVEANLSSGQIERATWNAGQRKLSFIRALPELRQEFTGHLLAFDASDSKWRMAGVFRNVEDGRQSGWYATRPRS